MNNTAPPASSFIWNSEACDVQPFHLAATVACGQNFRWRRDVTGIWWGTVGATVIAAWQEPDRPEAPLYWQTFPQPDQRLLVRDYFRLDFDLTSHYATWIAAEPAIGPAIAAFRGLRLLRQPPDECLSAFQCAACNTVTKIERSVAFLARHYGAPIETGLPELPHFPATGQTGATFDGFYAFPQPSAIAVADEAVLRAGLWGYRAPRLIAIAQTLAQRPPNWLWSLRQAPYAEAHAALTAFHGIGAKLADCICLFSLDKDEATPVDTHIRQIAVRLFAPELGGKSLTPKVYAQIAETYHKRFGPTAGWAQQYLFFPELTRSEQYTC